MSIQKRYLAKRNGDGTTVIDADGAPVDDPTQPRYRVRVATRNPVTGARQNKTIGTYRTRKEAQKAERDALSRLERGTLVDPTPLTVAELLGKWLESKASRLSPNSYKDYEIVIRRHLCPAFGGVPVQRLTPQQVQATYTQWFNAHLNRKTAVDQWRLELDQWEQSPRDNRGPRPEMPDGDAGLGTWTIHRCHVILSQALAQGVRYGWLYRNVCADVNVPKIAKATPQVWSPEEWRAFLDMAREDTHAPLWYFLAVEGMRRGEALGLRWSDVNWGRGTVHISRTVVPDKGDRGKAIIKEGAKTAAGARTVRLTTETLAVLRQHQESQREQRRETGGIWADTDLISSTSRGTPIDPRNVNRSYDRLVMIAGVPRIRVHDMRHTAATMLLRAGVPAKVVSERLGHATVSITLDTYSHVLPDMQDVAAQAMSKLFNDESPFRLA